MKILSLLMIAFLAACSSSRLHSPSTRQADSEFSPNFAEMPTSLDVPIRFQYPVRYPDVSSHFGWRGRRVHEGVDFKAPTGTRIYAAAAGRILMAGKRVKGYGRLVVIDHGHGVSSFYAHLSKSKVRVGQKVQQGQLIGLAGRTGRATAAHLHFEIRKGADPLDPLPILMKSEAIATHP